MSERRAGTAKGIDGWKDRVLMAAAFATILACTFGVGPFDMGGAAKVPMLTAQLDR